MKPARNNEKTLNSEDPEAPTIGERFIHIGDVKLSNIDLQKIVLQSEEIQRQKNNQDLQNDKEFMKSLNDYATQKSKEIIESTVLSDEIKSKNSPFASQKPEKPFTRKEERIGGSMDFSKPFINGGVEVIETNNLYFGQKHSPDAIAENKKSEGVSKKNVIIMPLSSSSLVHEYPIDIARKLLKSEITCNFKFTVEIYFGVTGIVRQCTFTYTGNNTFENIRQFFKKNHYESANFQWFYLNHNGNLMEVHNTLTLKHMLIAHGAYPTGQWNLMKKSGKVLCIPKCARTEHAIFERESDLIMGFENKALANQGEKLMDHLPYLIAPDHRNESIFEQTIAYSREEKSNPYNAFKTIAELIEFCQRPLKT
ncbi:unnamed protein product [Caenorhabditis sp. 36 PRJEB53466]|nr:unnamed protein product [Caenorhabditis sp. 36 PRJEB53466]